MHTDRSDGQATLEEMVRAAKDAGYAYCAITEHSKSLAMTFGFDTARVRESAAEIAAVRKKVPGIEVLHGLEVDILGDGGLDLDDEGLAVLDWVIVSLHSRLNQSREEMTRRVLRSLDHPRVHAMGHPTARRIGQRDPVDMDLEAVFERAAERGVAMEINAQPDRLDLSDVHARLAAAKGVPLVIDTDAHSIAQLEFMRYGVFVARRAGIGPDRVLNAMPPDAFREQLAERARVARMTPPVAARVAARVAPRVTAVASDPPRTPTRTAGRKMSDRGAKSRTTAARPKPGGRKSARRTRPRDR
jgi:DNA polymerase (family 10)